MESEEDAVRRAAASFAWQSAAERQRALSAVDVTSSVIMEQGLEVSPTAYFAAFLATLERDNQSPAQDELTVTEDDAARVCLLSLAASLSSKSVVASQSNRVLSSLKTAVDRALKVAEEFEKIQDDGKTVEEGKTGGPAASTAAQEAQVTPWPQPVLRVVTAAMACFTCVFKAMATGARGDVASQWTKAAADALDIMLKLSVSIRINVGARLTTGGEARGDTETHI